MNKIISFNNIDINTESFGLKDDPSILLIMGACSSLIWWEEEFCEKLADKGFFVIRYDLRDTGKSTTYSPFSPEYTFFDLADDAIHILDAYSIEKSIIMGMSMGGLITQIIATKYKERVNGIVLLASAYFEKTMDNLLGASGEIDKFIKQYKNFNFKDDEELLEYAFNQWKTTNKSSRFHDEKHIREMIKEDIKRSIDYNSRLNHFFIKIDEQALNYILKVRELNIPALIVHGTEDVVVPYEIAQKLKNNILKAHFYTMEGAGHELNSEDYDEVVNKINFVFKKNIL